MRLKPFIYRIKRSITNDKVDFNMLVWSNNDVLVILSDLYTSRIWTVNTPSSRQPRRPYLLSLTIRLLWAFSFHGWGKVWTGEKQLRWLSTAAVQSFQHTPMLQQTAQHTQISHKIKVKVKSNPQSAARRPAECHPFRAKQNSIPRPSPQWLHAKQHNRELITFELGIEGLLRLHTAGVDKRAAHTHKRTLPVAMTKQRRLFPVWHLMNRCSASSPRSSSTASCLLLTPMNEDDMDWIPCNGVHQVTDLKKYKIATDE